MSSCQGTTRYWNPGGSPSSGTFAFSCASPSYCPYLVWAGGKGACCPFANALVCLDGSCRTDTNCPVVVSSKAPVVAPTSARLQASASTATAARVSFPVNSLSVVVGPLPSTSTLATSKPAAPSTSGQTICTGGLVCGNSWFCSVDNPPSCCPKQGQSLCLDAKTCFSASNGEQCCGNTVCYSGQTCAPDGNACIGLSSSATFSATFSTATSERSFAAIVPSATATNGSDADPLNILQTAVPKSAQDDPAGACFLNTKYTTYTTPAWYTEMPTPAQTYFASVNAQNTDACVANSSPSNGLSDGAKAGIGLGVAAGVAALAALAFAFIKLGIIGSSATAAGGAATAASQPWSGTTGGESAWHGVAGSGVPHVSPIDQIPPFVAAGVLKKSSSSEENRSSYQPYRPPAGHPAYSAFGSSSTHGSHQQPPPQSISPIGSHISEAFADERHPSGMSGNTNQSPVQELSTSGAYPGYEIYSAERYEAPGGDVRYSSSPPEYENYSHEARGYGSHGHG